MKFTQEVKDKIDNYIDNLKIEYMKIMVLDYCTGKVSIIHIKDDIKDTLKLRDRVDSILADNGIRISDCYWMPLIIDEVGNFTLQEIYE